MLLRACNRPHVQPALFGLYAQPGICSSHCLAAAHPVSGLSSRCRLSVEKEHPSGEPGTAGGASRHCARLAGSL